jgi:hypothetical protein
MDKPVGLQLIIFSVLLAGLGSLIHYLAPAPARAVLIASLAGAGLCLLWGLRALRGHRGKTCAVLTLLPLSFVLLSQAVVVWVGSSGAPGQRKVALLIALAFALAFAMLLRIAYAGVTFEGPAARPRNHD